LSFDQPIATFRAEVRRNGYLIGMDLGDGQNYECGQQTLLDGTWLSDKWAHCKDVTT
jgi:hypothetical protein